MGMPEYPNCSLRRSRSSIVESGDRQAVADIGEDNGEGRKGERKGLENIR